MTRKSDLERLVPLIDAEFRSRQARLADLKRQEDDLQQRLGDLSGRDAYPDVGGALDAATLAGADLRWQKWAEVRRTEINQRIARLRVDQQAVTSELRRTFGRKTALDALCKSLGPGGRR